MYYFYLNQLLHLARIQAAVVRFVRVTRVIRIIGDVMDSGNLRCKDSYESLVTTQMTLVTRMTQITTRKPQAEVERQASETIGRTSKFI
jgi:hypothetical protein